MTPKRRWLLRGYPSRRLADKPVVTKTCGSDAELDVALRKLERDPEIQRTTAELAP